MRAHESADEREVGEDGEGSPSEREECVHLAMGCISRHRYLSDGTEEFTDLTPTRVAQESARRLFTYHCAFAKRYCRSRVSTASDGTMPSTTVSSPSSST